MSQIDVLFGRVGVAAGDLAEAQEREKEAERSAGDARRQFATIAVTGIAEIGTTFATFTKNDRGLRFDLARAFLNALEIYPSELIPQPVDAS
jgi:hypothetical protein